MKRRAPSRKGKAKRRRLKKPSANEVVDAKQQNTAEQGKSVSGGGSAVSH